MSEADNLRKHPADRRGVYEVWYTTWTDPRTGQGFWLRFISEAPVEGAGQHVPPYGDAPRGELWFARFDPKDPTKTFGIHKRFRADLVTSSDAPFKMVIAGCEQGNDHTFGDLSGGGHDVRWDLRWDAGKTMRFYPDAFYLRGGISKTMALSPNPNVPMSGTLLVDGEEIVFDRAPACQSHVWAYKHAYSWLWAHCNDFTGAPDTVLEVIGAKLQQRGVTLPTVAAISFHLDGEHIVLNQLRHLVTNRATWRAGHATFRGTSLTHKVEGELTSRLEDMVNAPYVDPDGTPLWCANTEIADLELTVWRRSGLRWVEHRRLASRGRAHYEVGSRERDPAVATPHVLVT